MTTEYRTNYSRGYVVEFLDAGDTRCESYLLLPAENLWSEALRGFLYILGLVYLFVGIAIASDIFMCAIEVITSKKKKITRWDPERQEVVVREVSSLFCFLFSSLVRISFFPSLSLSISFSLTHTLCVSLSFSHSVSIRLSLSLSPPVCLSISLSLSVLPLSPQTHNRNHHKSFDLRL